MSMVMVTTGKWVGMVPESRFSRIFRVCFLASIALAGAILPGCDDGRRGTDSNRAGENIPSAVTGVAPITPTPPPHRPTPAPQPSPTLQSRALPAEQTPRPVAKPRDERRIRVSGKIVHADGSPATGTSVSLIKNYETEAMAQARLERESRFKNGFSSFNGLSSPYNSPTHFGETVSDNDGNYMIEGPNTYSLSLVLSKPGYATIALQPQTGLVNSGQEKDGVLPINLDLVMRKRAYLSGRVLDEFHEPLTTVTVHAGPSIVNHNGPYLQDGQATTQTQNAGRYMLQGLFEGENRISCKVDGYVPFSRIVDAPASNVDIILEKTGASISGRVLLEPNKIPLTATTVTLRSAEDRSIGRVAQPTFDPRTGAMVTPAPTPVGTPPPGIVVLPSGQAFASPLMQTSGFSRQTTVTNDLGEFVFTQLPAGRYFIDAERPPYRRVGTSTPEIAISLSRGENLPDQNVALYSGHTISGRVVKRGTPDGVPGAKVSFLGSIESTTTLTDADGHFRVTGLFPHQIPTQVTLRAEKTGFSPLSADQSRGYYPEPRVKLTAENLETSGDIILIGHSTISGEVLDGVTSEPVVDASITVASNRRDSDQERVATDQQGKFSITALPGTTIRLRAEARRRAVTISNAIRVTEAPTTGIRILMFPGGSAAGVVVDPEDRPLDGVQVTARISLPASANNYGFSEQLKSATSNSGGTFAFTNLPLRDVYLDAKLAGYAPAQSLRLSLQPGEEKVGLKLKLRPAKTLKGKVLSADGKPVEGASVNVYGGGSSGYVVTKEEGRFVIADLVDAAHSASIYHQQHGSDSFTNIYPGDEEVELQFGRGGQNQDQTKKVKPGEAPKGDVQIIGNVVDYMSGEPVKDFAVVVGGLDVVMDPDKPGRFTASGGRAGFAYTFKIAAPDYALYETAPVFVPRNETVMEKTFRLGPGGYVVGRAVIATSGEPLAGVSVQMLGATNIARGAVTQPQHRDMKTEAEVKTDATGQFKLLSNSPGTKLVRFIPPPGPYVQITKEVDVFYNDTSDMGDIPMGGGGTIKGRLLRYPGDVPVADAEITCRSHTPGQESPPPTRTAADGSYSFTGLINGLYFLAAPQYNTDAWCGLEVMETKEADLRFGTGVINGTVTRGGEPHRASFRIIRIGYGQSMIRNGSTSGDGTFTAEGLPPGRWQITLTSLENSSWQIQDFVELPDSGGTVDRQFTMPTATLRVVVTDSASNAVDGARVSVRRQIPPDGLILPNASVVTTDNNGQAVFDGLAPGNYTVLAEKSSERAMREGVNIIEGGANTAEVQLASAAGGSLVSIALNMSTGLPVQQAWCYLFRSDGTVYEHSAQRDERGIMTIENITPGTYRTQVSALGFSVGEQTVQITSGETAQIDDVLYPAGSFRWALKDAAGNPAVGLPCRMEPADQTMVEKVREGVSDINGMFITRGLMPGTYRVTARPPGKPTVSVNVNIYASNATDEVTQIP